MVNDIDSEQAEAVAARITEQGDHAVASTASVDDPDQAGEIVQRCLTEFGRIDGLVNNACARREVWRTDMRREPTPPTSPGHTQVGFVELTVRPCW